MQKIATRASANRLMGIDSPREARRIFRAGVVGADPAIDVALLQIEASDPLPVAPIGEVKSAEADRNKQWREVGVGAQILRDLGVTSIIHLTSSVHDYKGLSGFGIEIVSTERFEG